MTEPRITKKEIWIIVSLIIAIVGPMYGAWQLDLSGEREAIRAAQADYREVMEQRVDWLETQLTQCLTPPKDNQDQDQSN